MLLVVTSNNIERGLIPTNRLFDYTKYGIIVKRLLRNEDKRMTVKFFCYNNSVKKFKLFTVADNCTINKRYIFTGNAGIIWFKLNFPLSYIRNRYGEILYNGGQDAFGKCKKIYSGLQTGGVLDDDVNPMEAFEIQRKQDENGTSWLEIYPKYQFGKKQYPYLSAKYKKLIEKYYCDNVHLISSFSRKIDDFQISNITSTNNRWITQEDAIDILQNGGWYILKNVLAKGKNEYYFGKAEYMSNRIKWQNSKIGHPKNNAYKIEPLFDYYNTWYFSFDILEQIYSDFQEDGRLEKIHTNLLYMIKNILKEVVGFISADMGCEIIVDNVCHNKVADNIEQKSIDDRFFESYVSMVTSNTIDNSDDESGKPHYVFNSYCTSWQSKRNSDENTIGDVAGLIITKYNDDCRLISTTSLNRSIDELADEVYYRYIKLDFSRMDEDFKKGRKNSDIYAGFLYGVEGLVNDILRFWARDLEVEYYNDNFDAATNTAFDKMVDYSTKK